MNALRLMVSAPFISMMLWNAVQGQPAGPCVAVLDAALAPLKLDLPGLTIDFDVLHPVAQTVGTQLGAGAIPCLGQELRSVTVAGRSELAGLTLVALAANSAALDALRRGLASEDPVEARTSLIAVGYLPVPQALVLARQVVTEDGDGGVRAAAAVLLSAIGDSSTLALLKSLAANDVNELLQRALLHAIPALERKLSLSSSDQLRWTDDGIVYWRSSQQTPNDANPAAAKLILAEGLSAKGRKFFLPFLCQQLLAADELAALLIGFQGDTAGIACLSPYAGVPGSFGDAVRDALSRLRGPAALRAMEAGLRPRSTANRALAEALGRLGDTASLVRLDRLARDTNYDATIRAAFAEAVQKIKRRGTSP